MLRQRGDFTGPLRVMHDRHFQGAVVGPVAVAQGVTLVVQGAFTGPLAIGEGAIVTIQGSYFATEGLENDGFLLLAGVTDHRFSIESGHVAVAAGTLLTHAAEPVVLGPDGSLAPLAAGGDVDVDATAEGYLLYDAESDTFRPMPPRS